MPLYPCRDDDDCSGRAFCNDQGACECFDDWGTIGLPGCTTMTQRSRVLLAVYLVVLALFVRVFFIHVSLMLRHDLLVRTPAAAETGKLQCSKLSRRVLFHLLSLGSIVPLAATFVFYIGYCTGSFNIRELSRRPLSAESVLASISGMSLVSWQLLIANMWYEAAQESGIYQPRTCIGRNIVRILMAFGLLLGALSGLITLADGNSWVFGPFSLLFCTVVALSYNFAVKAVLRGYLSALMQMMPNMLRQYWSGCCGRLTALSLSPRASLRLTGGEDQAPDQGSHKEGEEDVVHGSLAEVSKRPMMLRSTSWGSRKNLVVVPEGDEEEEQRAADADQHAKPHRPSVVPEEEGEGATKKGEQQKQQQQQQQQRSPSQKASTGSPSGSPKAPPPAVQKQGSVGFVERRRQHVHNEVVRLALTLTLLAAVPAVAWTVPIYDNPYIIQYTNLIGILAYGAANIACLYHLSPAFRKEVRKNWSCLGLSTLPDSRLMRIQQRLRRQPV